MLKIKLAPTGKKNQIHYRIVLSEARSKITGSAKEIIGHYHPLSGQLTVDRSRIKAWMEKGAQPTLQVRRLLKI